MPEDDLDHRNDPDPERRAALWGAAAAPALVLLGLGVGVVEGGLLPGACQGLACLFNAIVLFAAGAVAAAWLLIWFVVRLLRRRWPASTCRVWFLRFLALVSWGPVLWLVLVSLE